MNRRAYLRRRARLRAYGRWEPYAPGVAAAEHLERLLAAGASLASVSRASGLAPATLRRIRAVPARSYVAENLEWLLAVPAPEPGRAARARELVHALAARGWSELALAGMLGRARIRPTREGIAALLPALEDLAYELANSPPGPSVRARARAARHGWTGEILLDFIEVGRLAR